MLSRGLLGRWWQRRREARVERVLQQRAIPDQLWLDTLAAYPFLKRRPLADLQDLRELATLFLARKEFSTAGGLVLTDAIAVAIAAQACVPVLCLEDGVEPCLDWYDGFVGIVLQPDEVHVQRSWQDEDGIVHSGEEHLAGEAMAGGPVMLSWRDVEMSQEPSEATLGYNVVIHEFAHIIDMRNGDANGMPPLPSRAAQAHWQTVMDAEFDRLCTAVDAGEDTWLDPYAAQGPEELFAVASEAFFVAPHEFRQAHPALYELLQGFYRQDPARYA